MSEQAVLIAGYSGRALAASARRAGFLPLVADAFADTDTLAIAHSHEHLPRSLSRGFRLRSLIAALDRLSAKAPSPPIGLALAAGFEDDPELVAALESRYRLIGCGAEAIRAAKDPDRLFSIAAELGIAFPETSRTPPADATGWLTKRIGGSGGTHIARCKTRVSGTADRYLQREIAGEPLSMLGVVGRGAAFAFTSPWVDPAPRRPYRFGGLYGGIDVEADLEARLVGIGVDLARTLGLKGLVSVDFVIADGNPLLVDVNPRPGASLDVLDDENGTLFAAHLAALRGEDPTAILARDWRPHPRGLAYFYADQGPLTVPAMDWPAWVTDRPPAAAAIANHDPVVTVHAEAGDQQVAKALLTERLGQVHTMMYGHAKKTKETPR